MYFSVRTSTAIETLGNLILSDQKEYNAYHACQTSTLNCRYDLPQFWLHLDSGWDIESHDLIVKLSFHLPRVTSHASFGSLHIDDFIVMQFRFQECCGEIEMRKKSIANSGATWRSRWKVVILATRAKVWQLQKPFHNHLFLVPLERIITIRLHLEHPLKFDRFENIG